MRSATLRGKVALVTGGNAGIGLWTAIGLARRGARVLIAARDPVKGRAALAEIQRRSGRADTELLLADFASLEQVRRLAAEVEDRTDRLDVLINNAGLVLSARRLTSDGFEMTFGVNHLAPFLLTLRLRPLLERSAPARVVNVASRAHVRAELDFDDLQNEASYAAMKAYGRSKLANILFTRELARRLLGSGVTANCLHPGVVRTDFGADGDMSPLFSLAFSLAKPFLLSPEKGAETSVHLASAAEVEGISGEYFVRCHVARPSAAARDDEAASRLWRESERMVGESFEAALPARDAGQGGDGGEE